PRPVIGYLHDIKKSERTHRTAESPAIFENFFPRSGWGRSGEVIQPCAARRRGDPFAGLSKLSDWDRTDRDWPSLQPVAGRMSAQARGLANRLPGRLRCVERQCRIDRREDRKNDRAEAKDLFALPRRARDERSRLRDHR